MSLSLGLCLPLVPAPVAAASFPGINYSSVPPLPGVGIKANVLLMLDNSASMGDLAYLDRGGQNCSTTTSIACSSNADCPSGETCTARPPYYCFDDSYDDGSSYGGYFDRSSIYSYDFVNSRFVAGATLPASSVCQGACAASTSYLYLEMMGASPNRTVSLFTARGNFLNWLSASKLDLQKQALTGGKFLPAGSPGGSGMLLGETRGCQGKKEIKVAPGASQVTFAVGGPVTAIPASNCWYSAADGSVAACVSSFESLPSASGRTRIDIYDAPFNKSACLAAVADWRNGNADVFRKDAGSCLGGTLKVVVTDPATGKDVEVATERQVFVDAMTYCFTSYDPGMPGTPTNLQSECGLHVKYQRNDNTAIPRNAGDAICGGGYTHVPVTNIDGTNTSGFLGKDYTSGTVSSISERNDFCWDLTRQPLIDPSTAALKRNSSANLPSFIPDIGIYSLSGGQPPAGTLLGRILVNSAPSGLLQEFSGELNFGAMVFNFTGAGSECADPGNASKTGGFKDGQIACTRHCQSAGSDSGRECFVDADCSDQPGSTCQTLPRLDGGKVLVPVAGLALGDHSAGSGGLIYAIDQVKATSWSPLAETFYEAIGYYASRSDLRLQTADYDPGTSWIPCQKKNVLIVTDGISTADRRQSVIDTVTKAAASWVNPDAPDGMPDSARTSGGEVTPPFQGSYNLDDLAWIARHRNIYDFSKPVAFNKDYLSTYVVYTGPPCGSYNDDGSCKTTDEAVPEKLMQLTAAKGGGKLAKVDNPADIEQAFRSMLQDIAAGSGTGPCIVSTGDGNGAIYLREQFYPTRSFDGGQTAITWSGELSSLWYYIDPFIGSQAGAGSALREDSDDNKKLTLKDDKIVSIRFDDAANRTSGYLTPDRDGDGIGDGPESAVDADRLHYLWQAGQLLWKRDLVSSPRTIYTPLLSGGAAAGGSGMMAFSSGSLAAIAPYLNLQAGDPDAGRLIRFVQGFDPGDATMRSRTLPPASSSDLLNGAGIWKLGDILSSSPQAQTQVPLAGYHLPPPGGYGDLSYLSYTGSSDYHNRGMVYVGANDGMLHAFNLGSLDTSASGELKATLKEAANGSPIGSERWAFIPRQALPYLKYLASLNYRHLYLVDGKITLVDASIGSTASCKGPYWNCPKPLQVVTGQSGAPANALDPDSNPWRSVLIGSMGLGGASCTGGGDCVAPPAADPADGKKWLGYSSYFAFDVTDPGNPVLLWEFSDPALGYSTSGPAIVRIGEPGKNGRWFAVFGSGPTGPVDTATHQFLGSSSQQLQFFVVDLKTGELLATLPTGIQKAFAGSMTGAGIDADRWNPAANGRYQDDALYVGYSQRGESAQPGGPPSWSGGVLRVMTRENADPAKWQVSKVVDGVGPVTGGIARLQDRKNHNLWLYFGGGRYFFAQDDMPDPRSLYGIKEPCYNLRKAGVMVTPDVLDGSCTSYVNPAGVIDQTVTVHPVAASDPGWQIDLDAARGSSGSERLLTTPTATRSGEVFFATFQPSTDACQFGTSYLWGVSYETAGAIQNPGLHGTALVQLSNGALREIDLGRTFAGGTRRSDGATGLPGGMKIVTNSGLKPLRKIIHIQER
ncbi:MAG TPA: pilus assembly protein PilY [Geomonas sp.]|nr:pilus assembly protein PilY [Geomonas sp.]